LFHKAFLGALKENACGGNNLSKVLQTVAAKLQHISNNRID